MNINKLYQDCSDYLNNESDKTAIEIVNNAIEELARIDDPEIISLRDKCIFISNGWVSDTIIDLKYDYEELVEDLSGCLGNYLK